MALELYRRLLRGFGGASGFQDMLAFTGSAKREASQYHSRLGARKC